MTTEGAAPPQRKKYVFKKRDEAAAAKIEAERVANIKHNPFGDAKPREAVLAERTGKDEAELLKEEASSYDLHLKLTSDQFAEKKARQNEINELKSVLEEGADEDTEALKATISQKEHELDDLVKGFEALLVEKAKQGQLPRVDRKPFQNGGAGYSSSGPGSHHDIDQDGYQRQRGNRGQFQPGAYEESYRDDGAHRRRGGQPQTRGGHAYGPGGGYNGGGYNASDAHGGGYPHEHVVAYPAHMGPYGGYAGGHGPVFMAHSGAHPHGYAMGNGGAEDYHPIHER